jgi:hypothetical protein
MSTWWAVKEADGIRLRLVERAGWNGPPEELVDVAAHVAEELRGQCQHNLLDVLERIGHPELETDQAFCDAIDQEVFLCTCCGWWCEQSEAGEDNEGGEPQCDECAPEEEDED